MLDPWKRLVLAFAPTAISLVMVAYAIPMLLPTPAMAEIATAQMKELFGMEQSERLATYALSIKHAAVNDGKSLVKFIMLFVTLPYSFSYTVIIVVMLLIRKRLSVPGIALSKATLRLQRKFLLMQFLQSFLPLCILSIPLAIVLHGIFNDPDLGFATLPLTVFCWLCPSVQALVQLRYVRQTTAKHTIEPSRSIASTVGHQIMTII